jgi:periplasmic mercuric ion binding protein
MNGIRSAVVAGALALAAPAWGVESLQAKVNGMVCAFCAQGIEAKLKELPQTQDVYVNLGRKIVAVQVKDGMTLSPGVVRELVKDAGYEVSAIETVQKTTAQIKAETAKKK